MQGNFLDMPFEKETFDAAYAIEATCHANKVGTIAQPGAHPQLLLDGHLDFIVQECW